ncbi:MAG: magnesium transporter [Burkholderiaceae bacterium]
MSDRTGPAAVRSDRQDSVPAEEAPLAAEAPTAVPDDAWEQISDLISEGQLDEASERLEQMPLVDSTRTLLQLDTGDSEQILNNSSIEMVAEWMEELPAQYAADFVERLDIDRAASIIDQLDSDVQADLMRELESESADALLAAFGAANVLRRLVSYEADSAGGLDGVDALTFRPEDTVGMVLQRLASSDEEFERYRGQTPYVVDEDERVIGYASLRTLLTARRGDRLGAVMKPPITVPVGMDLFDLQDIFEEHELLSLPVVLEDQRIAGVVTRHSVDEAALHRAESESYKRQGVVGDELRSMPTLIRSRRRLAWLSANIGLNIIAASVISAYESTLTAVIAIAVFLPMVSDMSGCSGNQSVAVSLRELALGLIRPADALRVWSKEVTVGILNGLMLGVLIGLVAWVWKGNPALGLVIGIALALNTVLAVSIGGVVPLLLKRLNQDPAVASGPLLTTITDMAGFFFVLSLATAFMPWLV